MSVIDYSNLQGSLYYSLSKAALDQVTHQTAGIFIKYGIRVNSVNPGLVRTDIIHKMGVPEEYVDPWYDALTKPEYIPLGRCGVPDDIAQVILFLADKSKSEYIVGQCITADGGSTMRSSMGVAMDKMKETKN